MAKAYINSQMEARVALTQNAADWLTNRLGTLKTNVEISEKKLQDYREANNLVSSNTSNGDKSSVSSLSAEQLTAN
jgi:succinoglycan biosynthesis transport protein ExoP